MITKYRGKHQLFYDYGAHDAKYVVEVENDNTKI